MNFTASIASLLLFQSLHKFISSSLHTIYCLFNDIVITLTHQRKMSTKPWQQKALNRGRTPLPENPGDQPPLAPQAATSSSASAASGPPSSGTRSLAPSSTAAPSSGQAAAPTATDNQSYRFWPESELRRLIEMRNGGAEWSAISGAFPNRTQEALKQTYHKRRHAMERRMAEERAAAAAPGDAGSGPSVKKDAVDDNKGSE
ncbi:hypothetical protein FSARC_4819 [Fusarium sarcochroum]|uniref:Myb-like domain-containing protein n=1 Tax=Fusarium sarcochroum TaxID=1208366 RepID=A0A8H4U1C2_9HYPO|nr:hypothetical protein FSARC_4819 [Fusarium sarcochroum]